MKILIINSVCGVGSTGKIVVDLAKDFIKNGDKCVIAYGREKAPKEYESFSYRIGNDLTVRINGIKARLFDNEGFNAKSETKEFLKWADEYNPDLVWLHNLHGYYINVELLFNWLKSKSNLKVKWTLHDCWAFTGHCTYFTYAKCEKWRIQCENCPQKGNYPESFVKDNSSRNYAKKKDIFCNVKDLEIVTPSIWLKDLVKTSFLKENKVEITRNRIDRNIFKPTKSDFRKKYHLENKIILLGVANIWEERKGLNDFIELSKYLDDRYKIVIVGKVNKKIKNKNSEKILFFGRTRNSYELAKLYSAADIFLNLTHEDNYPTVNLEAKACGTPVVTYKIGGGFEGLGKDGMIVNNNIDELYKAVKEYIESRKKLVLSNNQTNIDNREKNEHIKRNN